MSTKEINFKRLLARAIKKDTILVIAKHISGEWFDVSFVVNKGDYNNFMFGTIFKKDTGLYNKLQELYEQRYNAKNKA